MWLAFVDETSDAKFKEYFGLSLALINSNFYPNIKREAHNILINNGWDDKKEFKGSYLFSAKKGCEKVSVEKRVEIASKLLGLNISTINSRMKFYYVRTKTTNQKEDYIKILPSLIKRALPSAIPKSGKDLLSVTCDYRSDLCSTEISDAIEPVVNKKGYILLEQVAIVGSCFETVGLLFADIVGYLVARIDTISTDSELFDNIPEEEYINNGKIRKLRSSSDLIKKIKTLELYQVK